ncbi:unnamed protein product [Phyllotreta striolata]|uniref:AAA+ ATPase domain-containing protein n=1 Tax=Phyllotreta striolata TaxID=444603 RepID=A0A9N9XL03_PHYSR|nr:unnamed protein product [Phyllotreta striolata]
MKDLKDYFSRSIEVPENEVPKDAAPENTPHSDIQNVENTESGQKRKRRKKKRKVSDPAVKNVTELLSTSLNLFSPVKVPAEDEVVDEVSESPAKENEPTIKTATKKNAFQFMMESRNRSIGTNSPGRQLEEEPGSNCKDRDKLKARRQVFSNWADQKGAAKRKRFEEEKDVIIEKKLNKRAKRLKKLLKVDNEEVSSKRVRRTKIVKRHSSSEDSDFECKLNDSRRVDKTRKNNTSISKDANEKPARNSRNNVKGKKSLSNNENRMNLSNGNIKSFLSSEKADETILTKNTDTKQKEANNEIVKEKISVKSKSKKVKETNLTEISNQDDNLVSKISRSWKLKIKINLNENVDILSSSSTANHEESDSTSELLDDSEEKPEAVVELSSDEEFENTPKKSLKVAPIFTKALPRPKEDPTVAKARREFLSSGLPDSLKKTIEKQTSLTERSLELDVFPKTQHVQQKCDSLYWNLPKPDLKLNEFSPLDPPLTPPKCQNITKSSNIRTINIDKEVQKVDNLKLLLNIIKAENPNYPVYKSFKQIYAKSGNPEEPGKRKAGRKPKKLEDPAIELLQNVAWTEKYKPKCHEDIIGNSQAVKKLQNWLECWKHFSQEINCQKQKSNNSESEFESTDDEDRTNTRLPGKIVIVHGPYGSGKTCAIYALCNELNFNVIELNASSKRTGKRLLQEVQEATQSHQVRSESQAFQNFLDKAKPAKDNQDKKMCVILIEDLDVVFEQDEGFISALLQFIVNSKRPIIATTTDYSSGIVQKYFDHFEAIRFSPLSSHSLATWMQIVFLCEGLYVSQSEIANLLDYNRGDVRKTLLQFQFWVQSGGQLAQNKEFITSSSNKGKYAVLEHKNCIKSFEIFEIDEKFKVPYYLNLNLLWWNVPNILDASSDAQKGETSKAENRKQLLLAAKFYDSMAYADVAFTAGGYRRHSDSLNRKDIVLKDSLELCECSDTKHIDLEFVHELTHSLLNGYVNSLTDNAAHFKLNLTMPDKQDKKWRTNLQEYETVYKETLLSSSDRNSTSLDYMPTLRSITRSECLRAASNTKRGNRFRNYLRDLNIRCNDNVTKTACDVFA